jgi:hypothetical protein
MNREKLIHNLRKEFVEGIVKYLDKNTISTRLMLVDHDMLCYTGVTTYAGNINVSVKVKETCSNFRMITFIINFDKYEREIVMYTPVTYTIEGIINRFFDKVTKIVLDTFLENNDLETVHEINKQETIKFSNMFTTFLNNKKNE